MSTNPTPHETVPVETLTEGDYIQRPGGHDLVTVDITPYVTDAGTIRLRYRDPITDHTWTRNVAPGTTIEVVR
jgi:hypothetical protein